MNAFHLLINFVTGIRKSTVFEDEFQRRELDSDHSNRLIDKVLA